MQKVSFSFPIEIINELDRERGELSRNRFVLRLLEQSLRENREKKLRRIAAEVYGDARFADEEERTAEKYFKVAPEPEQ